MSRTEKIIAWLTSPVWLPPLLGAAMIDSLPNGRQLLPRIPAWFLPFLWPIGLFFPFFMLGMIILNTPQSICEHIARDRLRKLNEARKAEAESKIPMYRKIATRKERRKKREQEILALAKKMKG